MPNEEVREGIPKARTQDQVRAWHRLYDEPAFEPDLPIIDPHYHLFTRSHYRYLLDEAMADLQSGHNIRGTVFVECDAMYRQDAARAFAPIGETEFANGVGAMGSSGRFGETRVCAGIVGFADLTLGEDVEDVLVAHLGVAPSRFRGIRNRAHYDQQMGFDRLAPEGLLHDLRFRAGFAKLGPLGLSFDSWVYFHQIHDVADLAKHFPQTTIILNHVGGVLGVAAYARRQAEVFNVWRKQIRDAARLPNIAVKIGGLGMLRCGFGFASEPTPPSSERLAAIWRPYIETCIEAFGPDRSMFESDFPVDGESCTYASLWNAFKRVSLSMNAGERHALFFGTARRLYRLDHVIEGSNDKAPSRSREITH